MSDPRVEVWDPSSEGPWLVERLRQASLDVRSIGLADVVLTRADLLVMAGDSHGALGALKLLRDEGSHGDVPVVLVGVPEGVQHLGEGPAFGADAVLARPVALDPLLACVRRLLDETLEAVPVSHVGIPIPERTMRLPGEADPASSQVFARHLVDGEVAWRPREPTLQLGDEADDRASGIMTRGAHPSSAPPRTTTGVRTPSGTGSRPGTGPSVGTDVPEPTIPPEQRAQLSPWLEELLRAADRRVFPDRPSLSLHFPAADEAPHELVPPELLEATPLRIDEPVIEDPIDAFTYVGGPAVPPPVASMAGVEESSVSDAPREAKKTSPETPGRLSRQVRETMATVTGGEASMPGSPVLRASSIPSALPPERTAEWPLNDTVLGRAAPDGSRRGALGRGGALRLVWRIARLELDALLELACDDGPSVRMTFLDGELRALDGPVAKTVLEGLRRRGRATEAPADEAGAEAVLQRRVELGELGRFERDRLVREARESILGELVASAQASFTLRRLDDTQPSRDLFRSRALARPIRAALVEAARAALDTERVIELLGSKPIGLAFGPDREAGLAPAELTSELCELLVRMEGRSLAEILAAAPTEPGLAGVLYALVAGDVLAITEPPEEVAPPPEARAAVRALLESAAELGDDGDYFSILGLARQAVQADVDRAYQARKGELAALPLGLLGLAALEERRRDAIEAVDEAYRVLRDARRRAAYAAAITV